MDIGLMVEGQNGLTWERWIHILRLAERLRFPTVFRSDHYFIGPQQDSLEAYLSFAVAARETSSIRFGPLVSPVTFRSPVDVGRMAAQLDQLSAGRFVMGMGAGWNEAEHRAYGIPFPAVKERFDRLDEAIQVVKALWAPGPASFWREVLPARWRGLPAKTNRRTSPDPYRRQRRKAHAQAGRPLCQRMERREPLSGGVCGEGGRARTPLRNGGPRPGQHPPFDDGVCRRRPR